MAATTATEESVDLERILEASPIQSFAFDFDLTLSRIHVYNARVEADHVPERWRDDLPYSDELSRILRGISASGRSWCVVTFGQPPVVTAYLEQMGFRKEEISVYSPLAGNQRYSEELSPPADKNAFLASIAESGGLRAESIALFDDDQRNVAAAVNAGFKGAVVHPGIGMSLDNFLAYHDQAATRAPVKRKKKSK
mmetsp:Transcript_30522/g.62111  ORF Transcript_30522/g.62111 Transcript_30522/m.62111 type:complete len:196 (-) Transcript_30522:203-790(-)